MSAYPTPFKVLHVQRVLGDPNAHGVRQEEWADAAEIAVYGWAPPSAETEPFEKGRAALVRDLDVYGPADLAVVTERDQVEILVGSYAALYEAVGGVESFDYGPFGFKPGCRLSLRLVEEDER